MANNLKINPATAGNNDSTAMERVAAVLNDYQGNDITSSNPLPVVSTAHISSDIEGKGILTIGTTATELTFTGTTESIIVQAHPENTGYIYVGDSTVTDTGDNAIFLLESGMYITIDLDDSTQSIYVVASIADQKVIAGASK